MTMLLHATLESVAAVLLLATLPLTIELVLLSLAATLPAKPPNRLASSAIRLAAVVPAHNEQTLIASCVHSLLSGHAHPIEVFVVAHNCTDRTAEVATQAGAHVLALEGASGKGLALDHGFQHAISAGADAVLVIDADSIVSPGFVDRVAACLAGGAEAVQARYQVANAGANFRTRLAAVALLGMNVLRPRGRARLGLSCGIFGNGFALSVRTLQRVPYTANSLVEDLEYHLRLVQGGVRVRFLDAASVFAEMPENSPAAATQRARWEGGRALMRRQSALPLLRHVLRGEWRLIEPLLDLLAQPLANQALVLLLALFFPVPWLHIYAATAFAAIALYVFVAATLSPSPTDSLRALAAAPGYLLWKLLNLPRTRRARREDAAWVRTQRNAEDPRPAHNHQDGPRSDRRP